MRNCNYELRKYASIHSPYICYFWFPSFFHGLLLRKLCFSLLLVSWSDERNEDKLMVISQRWLNFLWTVSATKLSLNIGMRLFNVPVVPLNNCLYLFSTNFANRDRNEVDAHHTVGRLYKYIRYVN